MWYYDSQIIRTPKTITIDSLRYGKTVFLDSSKLKELGIKPYREITPDNRYFYNGTYTVDTSGDEVVGTYAHIGKDTDNQVNGDGDTYVAYSFHSVEGHSKIGTYTGNGNADGVFVYLGFRPAFLMCKKISSTESWWVVDTARKSFNPHIYGIELNATADELAVAKDLDLLANGFKSRKATGYHNDDATYMYMAFAETPFKYANGR